MSADSAQPETILPATGVLAGLVSVVAGVIVKVGQHYEMRQQEAQNQTRILEELEKQRLSITANADIALRLAESQKLIAGLVQELKDMQKAQALTDDHQAKDHAKDQARTEEAIRDLQRAMTEGLSEIHRRMDGLYKRS